MVVAAAVGAVDPVVEAQEEEEAQDTVVVVVDMALLVVEDTGVVIAEAEAVLAMLRTESVSRRSDCSSIDS